MKVASFLVLPLLVLGSLFAADETEPPLGYTLKIDGKEFHLRAGEEAPLKGIFTDPKATIIPDASRHFGRNGMGFDYPAYFSYQYKKIPTGTEIWTVKGTRALFMIHHFTGKVTAESQAETIRKEYGDRGSAEPVSCVLHGVEFKGVRVKLKISPDSDPVFQDIYALPTESGSRILMLQDRPEKGEHSSDFIEAEKLLSGSLAY